MTVHRWNKLSQDLVFPDYFTEEMKTTFTFGAKRDANAQAVIGTLYLQGNGVPANTSEAIHWYEKSAKSGNASAAMTLARLYVRGEHLRKDNDIAVTWYEKAAAIGDAKAMHRLGSIYAKGKIVAKDLNLAVFWFRKAAKAGDASAQLVFALMLKDGKGVETNFREALEWLEQALNGDLTDENRGIALKAKRSITHHLHASGFTLPPANIPNTKNENAA
jgi:TPR repeat protein